jgi:hypothetical protein
VKGQAKRRYRVGAGDLLRECARRFQERVGREFDDADRERLRDILDRDDDDVATAQAVNVMLGAVKELERLPRVVQLASELRATIARHVPSVPEQAIRFRRNARAALVYEVDVVSFFGTGTEASDEDLAVVAFLSGVATTETVDRKKTAATLIAEEGRTLHKVRLEWGLASKRETFAKGFPKNVSD